MYYYLTSYYFIIFVYNIGTYIGKTIGLNSKQFSAHNVIIYLCLNINNIIITYM